MDDNDYTPFSEVYDKFYTKITDDMFMQLTLQETRDLTEDLLMNAIHMFEFPRTSLDYEFGAVQQKDQNDDTILSGRFTHKLTDEEINILATYMVCGWLDQQLANVDLTRMKYSGADYKFTSQANHVQKLLQLKKDYQREGFHLQRLYKRRIKDANGIYHSTFGKIMQEPSPFAKQKGEKPDDYKI